MGLGLVVLPLVAHAQLDMIPSADDAAAAVPDNIQIESLQTGYDRATDVFSASGNVHIAYGDAEIFADAAEYHKGSGDIFARGNVTIYKSGIVYKGDTIVYNTETGEITATDLRSSVGGLYFQAAEMQTNTDAFDVVSTEETFFTTDDSSDPGWRIKAKTINIYPDEKVVFKNVKFLAGNIPVFWLPYLSQPMDDELGYSFIPGYQSNWGGFFLNKYGFLIGDHTLAQMRLDYRTKRGIAGGIDLLSQRYRENPNIGKLILYGASDDDPTESANGRSRPPEDVDSGRYRVSFQHRIYLPGPEESSFYIDFDVNKFSDRFVLEDFYENEFRTDPRPDNIVNLVKQTPRAELSLLYRFRANDFFTSDTRSPEVALDIIRQPILNTGIYYNGETTAGVYKEVVADFVRRENRETIRELETDLRTYDSAIAAGVDPFSLTDTPAIPGGPATRVLDPLFSPDDTRTLIDDLKLASSDNAFTRFDTYHEILYPFTVGGWLNVIPRGGIRYTHYSDVSGGLVNSSQGRTLGHAGIQSSFKLSKVYDNVYAPKIGLDKLRHILQPYTDWSYIGGNDLPVGFPKIDRYAPTRELRPIDIPFFTAVDELRTWNIMRYGLMNRLQTQRNGQTYNWLEFNTYFEAYFEDPEFDRDFSNLFADLRWRPLPWFRLDVESQWPVFGDAFEFTDVNTELTFMPVNWSEISFGSRVIKDHPFFEDSNLFTISTYTRLGENWGFGSYHRYEADDSTLEWQQYTLHRDLQSWTASFGGMVRNNRTEKEYGFVFTLSLKEFPQVGLPLAFSPTGGGPTN
ncbi:MAG: hypothetical protein AAF591_21260 [Verrucomicrobiota bacterium]